MLNKTKGCAKMKSGGKAQSMPISKFKKMAYNKLSDTLGKMKK
jgi:hypothetical protein